MFVCVFAKKFPALASQSCCEVSRPRAVGEYEYRLLFVGRILNTLYRFDPFFTCTVFSHDVTAVISVFQDNETAAMLFQTNPVLAEPFPYVKAFFFPIDVICIDAGDQYLCKLHLLEKRKL